MKISAKILLSSAAIIAGSFAAMMMAVPAVQAQNNTENPNTVCIHPQDIQSTQTKDARTIVFQMRDGTVWLNTLVAPCPNLVSMRTWTQTVHSDVICANKQTITVLTTGNVCRLGPFTRVK